VGKIIELKIDVMSFHIENDIIKEDLPLLMQCGILQ